MAREQLQAEAVVLRKVDYGERDRILTLLVNGRGKRSAFAKGARGSKRFSGALESYRVSQFTLIDRGIEKMATLTEARVVTAYPGIEASFDKLSLAAYCTELVRELLQDGEGGDVPFQALTDHYARLHASKEASNHLESDLNTFILRVLSNAGFAPALSRCFRCGKKVSAAKSWCFVLSGQGARCPKCSRPEDRGHPTHPHLLMVMGRMSQGYLQSAPEAEVLRDIRPMIKATLRAVLGKDLRSRQFLNMVLT
jgi:DNA repair protein RecO (recombination protein O)